MKCFLVLLVVCAAISLSEQAMTKEEAFEMFLKIAKGCQAKEGSTDADMEEAKAYKMPTTQTGKCLHACIGETIGVMKDNKVSKDGSIAVAKTLFDNDPAKLATAGEIADECMNETDGDRCEAALKMMLCQDKALTSRGLKFGEW